MSAAVDVPVFCSMSSGGAGAGGSPGRSRTLAVDVWDDRRAAKRLVDDGRCVGVPTVSRSADQSCDVGGLRVAWPSPRPGSDVRAIAGLATGGSARLARIASATRVGRSWTGHRVITSSRATGFQHSQVNRQIPASPMNEQPQSMHRRCNHGAEHRAAARS